MKKVIKTNDAPQAAGPYSQAILAGNTLYISGQIPIEPSTGQLISGDISEQTRLVMNNIGNILKAAGMNYENIVKVNFYLTDIRDFASANEAYAAFFSDNFPARETIEASRLPKDAKIEISVIAVKD